MSLVIVLAGHIVGRLYLYLVRLHPRAESLLMWKARELVNCDNVRFFEDSSNLGLHCRAHGFLNTCCPERMLS
jgi:hypothetical protein